MLRNFTHAVQACEVGHIRARPGFHFDTCTHLHLSAVFSSNCLLSLTMPRFDVIRVRAAVWKWLCRCPEAVGPVGDTSDDDVFFTPPTSPSPRTQDQHAAITSASPASITTPPADAQRLLSPAQQRRLRRRHEEVVRQLTAAPPVVTPRPHSPLKAFQRPVMVYRPSWAP